MFFLLFFPVASPCAKLDQNGLYVTLRGPKVAPPPLAGSTWSERGPLKYVGVWVTEQGPANNAWYGLRDAHPQYAQHDMLFAASVSTRPVVNTVCDATP